MASNINPNNIDATYPVAGQDNDSQGFRDNFTNIKNNLAYAQEEINDLQNKAIFKAALSESELNNNMGGALLKSAKIQDFRETRVALGLQSESVVLDYSAGHYQTITTDGDVQLSFSNWPAAGNFSRIRIAVTVGNVGDTVTLPSAVTQGLDQIQGLQDGDGTQSLVLRFLGSGKTYEYEFTSSDGGSTVFLRDLSTASHGVPETRVLTENVTTTTTALTSIAGLEFTTVTNARYQFEALLPFSHSGTTVNTHTFSLSHSAGTSYYVVEQQADPNSAFTVHTQTGSEGLASTVITNSDAIKICKISGTFTHTSPVTVYLNFATDGGTLTVYSGAYLKVTRLAG